MSHKAPSKKTKNISEAGKKNVFTGCLTPCLWMNAAFSLSGHLVSHTVICWRGCKSDSVLLNWCHWPLLSLCPPSAQTEHQRQRHADHHRRRRGRDTDPGPLHWREQPFQAFLHHPWSDSHLPFWPGWTCLWKGRRLHYKLHRWMQILQDYSMLFFTSNSYI